jgi:hypothetical protein
MSAFAKHMSALSCAALILAGCFGTDDDEAGGKADVTYVAIGNSLTAGFQSGGLRADWQRASYPAKLAEAMGIADFQLPVIDSPGIGRLKIGGKAATPLHYDSATRVIAPRLLEKSTSELLSNFTLGRPYNNLGVPGATASDLMHAYDSNTSQSPGNGYFNIVIRGGLFQNASMLRQAIKLEPTLLTLWIGNNEILGGITAGTVSVTPPLITVVPAQVYTAQMDSILDTLMRETSARIFMANVPSITSIPYVTTVPKVIFDPATFQPVLDSAGNPIPFLTKEADVEYVLLPALADIAAKKGIPTGLGGTGDSLGANLTLTKGEAAIAKGLVDAYNAYLKKKAEDNSSRLTLVDVNALLNKLTDGQITGLSSKFILLDPKQTAFSLDGIHPNAKGYKEVTNLFIKTINATLDTRYPEMQ